MACKEGKHQRCRGNLSNLTHIGAEEIKVEVGSKVGVHVCKYRPELTQNEGLEFKIQSLPIISSKYTMKNP